MIQLRNVPDALHRKLKARAAEQGLSLSDYLIQMAKRDAERPTIAQFRARWETLPVRELSPSPTEIIREERDRR
jgi:plasmid stability protein